ncbi:hypothetical protein KIPE111705_46740 [Kibdelosporangium persicum]
MMVCGKSTYVDNCLNIQSGFLCRETKVLK